MDHQKDYIHIDDVFKKLRDGEEPEGAGAWLRMRDLLDKEMPSGTIAPAAKPWKRYLLPVAALLLIGSATTWYNFNPLRNTQTATTAQSTVEQTTTSVKNSNTQNPVASNMTASNHSSNVVTVDAKNNTYAKKVLTPSSVANNNLPKTSQQTSVTEKTENTSNKLTGISQKDISIEVGKNSKIEPKQITFAKSEKQIDETQQLANQLAVAAESSVKPKLIQEEKVIASYKGDKFASETNVSGTEKFNTGDKKMKPLPVKNRKAKDIVSSESGNFYREIKDTITKVDITAKSQLIPGNSSSEKKMVQQIDTVAITRVERTRYIPLTPLELVSLREIVLAAKPIINYDNLSKKVIKQEFVEMIPLSEYKVASKSSANVNGLNKFTQLISNRFAGYFDGSKNYYAGIMLGGNTAFGNPNYYGMQIGIAGMFQLNERLTLGTELRYVNHYFGNYSLTDQAVSYTNEAKTFNNGLYHHTGTKNEQTSVFQINNIQSLQLPITLNYYLGRASVYGGINLAYAAPFNWTKTNTLTQVDVQSSSAKEASPFTATGFEIDAARDFSSRLGIGYVWGLNYDVSRKVSLDARITQNLWDNNKGTTAAIKKLFHLPTMQVSIGYYFGRKDKLMYMMKTR